VTPRFWGAFRVSRFLVYATSIVYLTWVIDRHRETAQVPAWLGMARVGLLFVTLWACVQPRMFVWEPVALTLRSRGRDPETFAHKSAVAFAIAPLAAALVVTVSGGPAVDVYILTAVCLLSVSFWTRRYWQATGAGQGQGSRSVRAG
jgi:hypothetical protein